MFVLFSILCFVLCSESGDEADDEKEREKTIDVRLEPLSVETAQPQPVPVPSHYVKTLRLTSEEIVSSNFLPNFLQLAFPLSTAGAINSIAILFMTF